MPPKSTNADRAASLAGYEAQTAIDAADLATKKALAAKDAVDPAKQAEREQAERNRTLRAEQERSAPSWLARLSPRRNRWRDVAEFDERIAKLEQRQADIGREIGELEERLRQAPAAHEQRLAEWIAAGERGDRPLSEAPELERYSRSGAPTSRPSPSSSSERRRRRSTTSPGTATGSSP